MIVGGRLHAGPRQRPILVLLAREPSALTGMLVTQEDNRSRTRPPTYVKPSPSSSRLPAHPRSRSVSTGRSTSLILISRLGRLLRLSGREVCRR